MSDSVQALRRPPKLMFLVAGVSSSLLFVSVFLSFAFLLPVQMVFGRRGSREGMAAAGASALCIAVAQATMMATAGSFGQGRALAALLELACALAMPVILLSALALINAPFGIRMEHSYRVLGVTALCALIAFPALLAVERNGSITAFMEKEIGDIIAPVRGAAAAPSGGYEVSALSATLDPKDIVATSFAILRNTVAAIIFSLLAGSWWLGNRMSGKGSRGWETTSSLDRLRLPYPFLWVFLLSWTYVLAVVLLKADGLVSSIAWNCALVASLAYAGPGLGIVSHLLKTWNTPKSLRICLAVMAVIALATPLGIAVAASLPLLGVTEIWIHYRKPKGVGA
jgi:hypothetical protein